MRLQLLKIPKKYKITVVKENGKYFSRIWRGGEFMRELPTGYSDIAIARMTAKMFIIQDRTLNP
jgi:hypothetical protein